MDLVITFQYTPAHWAALPRLQLAADAAARFYAPLRRGARLIALGNVLPPLADTARLLTFTEFCGRPHHHCVFLKSENMLRALERVARDPSISDPFLWSRDNYVMVQPIELADVQQRHSAGLVSEWPYDKRWPFFSLLCDTAKALGLSPVTAINYYGYAPVVIQKQPFLNGLTRWGYRLQPDCLIGHCANDALPPLHNGLAHFFDGCGQKNIMQTLEQHKIVAYNDDGINETLISALNRVVYR